MQGTTLTSSTTATGILAKLELDFRDRGIGSGRSGSGSSRRVCVRTRRVGSIQFIELVVFALCVAAFFLVVFFSFRVLFIEQFILFFLTSRLVHCIVV